MSSHPTVGFRALQTKLLSRSRFHDSGLDHGRSRLVHATTAVQTATCSLKWFRPPTFDPLRFTSYQQDGQGKTQHCVNNKKGSAELGRVVVDTQHSFVLTDTGTVERSFTCCVPHAPGTRIRRVSVSFGMTALPCPTFKSVASLQLETQVHLTLAYIHQGLNFAPVIATHAGCTSSLQASFTWPASTGLPRSSIHGAVTLDLVERLPRSRNHTWMSPISFFVSPRAGRRGSPALPVLSPFPACLVVLVLRRFVGETVLSALSVLVSLSARSRRRSCSVAS